jgi:DnaK suppressor protein
MDLIKFEKIINEKIKEVSSRSVDFNVDAEGDESDEIQSNFILHMAYDYNDRNKATLNNLFAALAKIKDKSYGLCEECDEYISERRLEILPEVKLCVRCAEIEEKRSRQ